MEESDINQSPVIMSVSKEDDGTITQVYLTDDGHHAIIKEGVPIELEKNGDESGPIKQTSCWKKCVLITWFVMFYIVYILMITVYLSFLNPYDISPYVLVRNHTSGALLELPYSLSQSNSCLRMDIVVNGTNKTKMGMDPLDFIKHFVNVGSQNGETYTSDTLCI
ncbi:hypothetical protein [Marmot herpesvirus 1]|nr:hypothetical protein [Marmot herpesvirus 1]